MMQRIPDKSLIILLLLACSTVAIADDERRSHTVKLKVGGELTFEAPSSWGNRPEIEHGEEITVARFTPAGTPREPIFHVSLSMGVPEDAPTAESVRQVAELIREELKDSALEPNIEIHRLEGSNNTIDYFTITDKEIKPREYQYLTTAVVSDGKAIVSSYFFSNDGAPDYAADAMHLLESVSYTPGKKKKKKKRR